MKFSDRKSNNYFNNYDIFGQCKKIMHFSNLLIGNWQTRNDNWIN